jgi:integrase/recombinase XerD
MPVRAVLNHGHRTHELVDQEGNGVELVNAFLSFVADTGKSPNTVRAYAYDLQYLLWFLAGEGLLFTDFRPRHTPALVKYLRNDASRRARSGVRPEAAMAGRTPRMLSDATVSRVLAAVSAFYEFLIVSEFYESENPVLVVQGTAVGQGKRRPALGTMSRQVPVRRRVRIRTTQRLPRPMAREDVERFVASLRTRRDRAIFLLCVNGGLRPSEVLTLRLSAIQYGLRRVTIRVANDDPRGLRTKSLEERIVDLHDGDTLRAVSDYVMHERPKDATTDIVFLVGRNGARRLEPLSYAALNRLFARHLSALGLRTPWTTPHALRHSHATEMFEGGMRDMTLQKRLGHASPASTKIYTRVGDREVRDDYTAALRSIEDQKGRK